MFDIIIQPQINTIIDNIKEIFIFTSELGITLITLYTAWLRFVCKRIDIISSGISLNTHSGNEIFFTIENKTLSNFIITKIDIVLNNQYIFELKKFSEPFTLEPFKAYTIRAEKITDVSPININELNDMFVLSDIYCIIQTPKGPLKSYFYKSKSVPKYNFTRINIFRNYFNGKVLPKDAKYIISILCESGKYKDILIDNSGFMSDDLYGINYLSTEIIKDFHSCYEFFKKIGLEKGLTFYLYNVAYNEDNLYVKFTPPPQDNPITQQ